MANTINTDIAQILMTNAANLASQIPVGNTKVSTEGDFSKVMSEATEKVAKTEPVTEESKSFSSGAKVDKSSTSQIKEQDQTKKNPVENKDDRAEVAKDAVDVAADIRDTIKETMKLDDEDIENAMTALGINLWDLLDPKNVQNLMMELGGVSDSISLITNAELYGQIKDVTELVTTEFNNLLDKEGITVEEFAVVLEDTEVMEKAENEMPVNSGSEVLEASLVQNSQNEMTASVVQNDVTGQQVNSAVVSESNVAAQTMSGDVAETGIVVEVTGTENIVTDTENVVASDAVVQTAAVEDTAVNATNTDKTNDTQADVKSLETVQQSESATKESAESVSETETFKGIAKSQTDPMKGRNEGFENVSKMSRIDRSQTDGIGENINIDNVVSTKTEVNSVGDIVETVTTYTSGDANEILSQVTESIRVNFTPDSAALEMQLHPASLGTVNMHVVSTNGVITAQIIVESEAVKAALESQLLTLQETFAEQGHKVEAVEVSIANYDLNQGMNKNNGQNDGERKEKEAFRVSGARRRINLSDLEVDIDSTEAVTEEEKIARDMMARSGNTLDYMA